MPTQKIKDLTTELERILLDEGILANVKMVMTVDIGTVPSKKESDHVCPVRIRTDEESILRERALKIARSYFNGEIVIESKAIIVKKTE